MSTFFLTTALTQKNRRVWILRSHQSFGRDTGYARSWGARERRGEVSRHYSEPAASKALAKLVGGAS